MDVIATGVADEHKTPLLAIGEAKWGEVMGASHLERLRQIKALLDTGSRYDTSQTKLICFSAAGFSDRLRDTAMADGGILLVDAEELYRSPGPTGARTLAWK